MRAFRFSSTKLVITLLLFTAYFGTSAKRLPSIPATELQELSQKLLDFQELIPKKRIIMEQAIEEFNLTTGKSESPDMHLHNSTKRTVTAYGDAAHRILLENPLGNQQQIIDRQSFIKQLVNNPDLVTEFDNILYPIAYHQENVLMLWSLSNPLNDQSKDFLANIGQLTGLKSTKHGLEVLRWITLLASGTITAGLLGGTAYYTYDAGKNHFEDQASLTSYLWPFIGAGLSALWWYKFFPSVKHMEKINKDMQEMMISVGTTIRAAQALSYCLQKEAHGYKALAYAHNLRSSISQSDQLAHDLQTLINELNAPTFKGEPAFSSHMGRVRTTYQLVVKLKESLLPVLKAIGEVDALISPAKLMHEYEEQPVHYCFTEFVPAQDPVIKLQKSWNPVIKIEDIVTEDISLGGGPDLVPNMLLTGPHGGGKSTIMRQVAYSVILSQVFGISPCDQCAMTLFQSINSYLDIKDNMEAGKSTFMAERDRIEFIKHKLLGLQEGKFGFTVVDELFKGTMEAEASKLVTKFMEKVEMVTESVCIMASHFVRPAIEAEKRSNSRFANYHMQTEERTLGRFKRTFKLDEGRCDWWFADAAKRDRYVKWLQTVVT